MGPSHNPTDRTERRDTNPLESFVQLVMPQPLQSMPGCAVVDTSKTDLVDFEPPPASLIDSPDDLLAEAFSGIDPMQRHILRGRIEEWISSIRVEVTRSFSPEHEGIAAEERRMEIRYGASRRSLELGPIVWVECRCLDTGCYVLPRLRDGMCGAGWSGNADEDLPERFFEGPARFMLEFDTESDEVVRCFPFVSRACETEAERHLMVALRSGEATEASYLVSQYHDLVIAQAVHRGDLSPDASQVERSEYLLERQRPQRVETSFATDGSRTYSLAFGEREGQAPFVDVISLVEAYPWGLQVSGLTTVRR